MKKCNYLKLAECLNNKYEIKPLSDKKMFEHFNQKYNSEIVKQNEELNKANKLVKNSRN